MAEAGQGEACATVQVELPDGTSLRLGRRDFMRIGAVAAAAAGIAGCAPEQERILPRVHRPEEARPGLPLNYATACQSCPAGCGVVARAREGRVVKVEGNAEHPVNRGALCARGQASVLDLYDPDRARSSMLVARGKAPPVTMSPEAVDQAVTDALKKANGGKPRVAVLTGSIQGPAMRSLLTDFVELFASARVVEWEPLGSMTETIQAAQELCYGKRLIPQYRLDRADVIVSFGAEFLDTGLSPVQLARYFAKRRRPEDPRGMSLFWVFEGRMSLTGSNADHRVRVRPSHLADVAMALANAVLVERKFGPLAGREDVTKPLAGFGVDAVAARTGVDAGAIRAAASDLIKHASRGVVMGGGAASTGPSGLALEIAVNLLNSALGNDGPTVDWVRPSMQAAGPFGDLAELVHELRGGKYDALIIWGANPVYSAPPVLGFAEAMAHVPLVVSIADRLDETSRQADYLVAAAHWLEAWTDVAPLWGIIGVGQPAMQPVGAMRGLGDVLASWASLLGATGALADATAQAAGKDAVPSAAYHYIKRYWREHVFPSAGVDKEFEEFWRDVLHRGVLVPETYPAPGAPREFAASALALPSWEAGKQGELELALHAPHGMYDGRSGNNGWLLEYPDPVTKITWDAWVGLSPRRMKAIGLIDGDVCEVKAAGYSVWVPAVSIPGQHDDVASVPLGFGRTAAGVVGNDIGANAFTLALMTARGPQLAGQVVTVRKAGWHVELAIPQGEKTIDLSERPLIPLATLGEFRKDPKAGTERPEGDWSIWPRHEYPDVRWGMAVDLSACIGCGACTIACQAENNIPTAGRKGVRRGREMHWLRVDRYHVMPVSPRKARTRAELEAQTASREKAKADPTWLDNPVVVAHPLMCQHCENAPCETVCPVGATNHSNDGLNVQAYNRCVGTRYCSNNCPFKARRFNWFDYSRDRDNWFSRLFEAEMPKLAAMNNRWPLQLRYNPEVTVRSRGVMEKCTFCVQRIAVGRGKAKDENRKIKDGDVVPACAETCPTQAIKFGNLSDPTSEVAKLRASPRGLTMLDEQKVGSSVTYLTKVRNDEG